MNAKNRKGRKRGKPTARGEGKPRPVNLPLEPKMSRFSTVDVIPAGQWAEGGPLWRKENKNPEGTT